MHVQVENQTVGWERVGEGGERWPRLFQVAILILEAGNVMEQIILSASMWHRGDHQVIKSSQAG